MDVADHTTPKMHARDAIASLASLLGCYRVSAALHAQLLILEPQKSCESELLQSILFYRPSTRLQCTAPEHAYAARAMPLELL